MRSSSSLWLVTLSKGFYPSCMILGVRLANDGIQACLSLPKDQLLHPHRHERRGVERRVEGKGELAHVSKKRELDYQTNMAMIRNLPR